MKSNRTQFKPALPLARSTVDRDHLRRLNPDLLSDLRSNARTKVVVIWSGKTLVRSTGEIELKFFSPKEVPSFETWFYLGHEFDVSKNELETPYLGVVLENEDSLKLAPETDWRSLREIGALLSSRDSGLLVEAVALANWRDSHRFSPRSGHPLQVEQSGWVLRDPVDGLEVFPRIDPAIIVTITDQSDRILLGSNALWQVNRYSLLAGFVEPGESLEAAVIREVEEESGIRVSDPRYLGSQAWPYPASLMLGFSAVVAPNENLQPKPDGVEILDLRWFTREELRSDPSILLPGKTSIARAMIDSWLEGN